MKNHKKKIGNEEKLEVSDAYISSNKHLFDLKEDTKHGPFDTRTRTLLLDSILTNLEIKFLNGNNKKIIKGLPLMISAGIFEECFPLHDQTSHILFTSEYIKMINDFYSDNLESNRSSIDYLKRNLNEFSKTDESDSRRYLQENWAALRNLFKYQPLGSIRDYFGEQNAIYFGFVGSFIKMLLIPSLFGIVLFGISLYYYYR